MFKSGILSLVFALTALSFMGCSHPVTGSAGVDGTGGVSSNLGGGANAASPIEIVVPIDSQSLTNSTDTVGS